ncbi:amidase [Pseudomonas taiwanensis]|uniref:amidase n=1 Tax=Pseudomonas taiwanensis TaxID=470150 RepID=UPI0004131DFC|nr:amidase [Pseudomonas taiwanensis]
MNKPPLHTDVPAPLADASALAQIGAVAMAEAFRRKELSPVEATQAALDRAEEINPKFNAFTFLDAERALAAAHASERRWRSGKPLSPVDGIPTTLKDIVWVEGWRVSYGSHTTSQLPCSADAPAVGLMRNAGSVFIGQTTTPEFGWKAVTDSPRFGVTRNPYDPSLTPGGSSGGAAVAAATGAGVLHLGTDGGGSIRVPAAFTGIVGLKPTFGRVPAYPASVFGTVAHLGPMARSVADAELMLHAMSGRSITDWAQGAGALPALHSGQVELRGQRIAYWRSPPQGHVDLAIQQRLDAVVERLVQQGASVEVVDLPAAEILNIFQRHWFSGAAARLAALPQNAQAFMDPGFISTARQGGDWSAAELVDAQNRRAAFGAAMESLLNDYDVLISPAASILPFAAGMEVPPDGAYKHWTEWAGFSFPINLSQQPALAMPCGTTENGIPIGLQLVMSRGQDARLLALGKTIELLLAASH